MENSSRAFPTRRAQLWKFALLLLGLCPIAAWAQPVINAGGIVNATGYQTTLAPDTVFLIYGSGLGPAKLATAAAPNYPSSVGGTSITFTQTSGGAATNAKMIYSVAGQVAGLLPSSIKPGTYAVQVSYNGQSSGAQNVNVVARSFGIATSNGAGTGAAQATIGNVNGGISLVRTTTGSVNFGGLAWTLTPAHPSDQLVLWGTGGGADPANDTGGTSGDQTAAGSFSVTVDGTKIIPVYAGASSGYPGLWQINFQLPANIGADCFASVQVTAGGQLSNSVTIAIAGAGQTSCTGVLTPATLAKLDSGTGTITMAGLSIGQVVGSGGSVGGALSLYTVQEFLIPYSGPKIGSCNVLDETYPNGSKEPAAPDATLDLGTLTITGPTGAVQTIEQQSGPLGVSYSSPMSILNGGIYTLHASGSSQVAPFVISRTFPTGFTVSGFDSLATINRSQPLPVSWAGTGFTTVKILIVDNVVSDTTTHGVALSCSVAAANGAFTVPVTALSYLPAGSGTIHVLAIDTYGGTQSAESTMDPNTVILLSNGAMVDFGGFSPFIDYSEPATIN